MHVLTGPAPGGEAVNLGLATALVRHADEQAGYEGIHVYRPVGRNVVFGRRETRLPGFPAAVRAARAAGFEPLVRATGGRAVAYTEQTVVVHHVRHEAAPTRGHDARFETFGRLFVETLGGLGVEARLGPVPGEYCPGAHSVNARGEVKLVGTAQRILRQAWLFSSLVVVGDEEDLRDVLARVYAALGQDFDASSVGSLVSENAALGAEEVTRAVLRALVGNAAARPVHEAEALLARAAGVAGDHRVRAEAAMRTNDPLPPG
jgi:lipoate-protein ligase A